MKRIIILFLSLLLALAPVAAFADAAGPSIEAFKVCTGPDGIDHTVWNGDTGNGEPTIEHADLPLGTVITIYDHNDEYWYGYIDSNHSSEWYVFSDEQLKMTYGEKDVLPPEIGEKEEKKIEGKVHTDDKGLNMRYGPSQKFGVIQLMQEGSSVSYEYTYNGWAYVDFGGKHGWASLEYIDTQSGSETVQTPVEQTDQESPAVETTEPESTEKDPQVIQPAEPEEKPAEAAEKGSSFVDSRAFLILCCCIVAAVTSAVTAIVILRILARRARENDQE